MVRPVFVVVLAMGSTTARRLVSGSLAATAADRRLSGQRTRLPQVLDAAPDGAAGDLGRSRRGGYAAVAGGEDFRRRVQPPTTLIQRWPDGLVAGTNGVLIDHELAICSAHRAGNPPDTTTRTDSPISGPPKAADT